MDQILAQASDTSELDLLLDLMRRLPPEKIDANLQSLLFVLPEYTDDLLTSIDLPLKIQVDPASGREFLNCDYNRDQDSYRFIFSLFSVCLRKLDLHLLHIVLLGVPGPMNMILLCRMEHRPGQS